MESSERTALVRLDGLPVGLLREHDGRYFFGYFEDWVASHDSKPVSLTMPVRLEPYESRFLHPFFQNLLPEGWLLELATKKLKISKDDAFGLLLATCADCIGDVEILPLTETGYD